MNKTILVLEENSVVHGMVASALDMDGLTVHHEFNPAKFVDRARALVPDLILMSNSDQHNNYSICRQLKTGSVLAGTPLVLLANSRDRLDDAKLRELRVGGVVRKPFEASDLQQQINRHLNLTDLIGSAYEYRQSQSSREDAINPLAGLEALDEETVALMKDAGHAPEQGLAVPEVDFSLELQQEREHSDDAALEGTLEPERAFEPVPEMDADAPMEFAGDAPAAPGGSTEFDDSDLVPFPGGKADTLLEADAFGGEEAFGDDLLSDEPLGAPGLEQPFLDEDRLEELGPEDLLEEEPDLEAGLSTGMDEPLEDREPSPMAPLTPSSLDKIQVDLSESDLALSPEGGDDMTMFESLPSAPAQAQGETIPAAVRRMMALKPVLAPPVAVAATGITAAQPPEPRDSAPEFAPPLEAELPIELEFGNEELDEERILAAAAETEFGAQSEDEIVSALGRHSDPETDALNELPDLEVDLAAPEEDDEEITIDEDEEELILASLDEEERAAVFGDERASPAPLELTAAENAGLEETLSVLEEPSEAGYEDTLETLEIPVESAASREPDFTRLEVTGTTILPVDGGEPITLSFEEELDLPDFTDDEGLEGPLFGEAGVEQSAAPHEAADAFATGSAPAAAPPVGDATLGRATELESVANVQLEPEDEFELESAAELAIEPTEELILEPASELPPLPEDGGPEPAAPLPEEETLDMDFGQEALEVDLFAAADLGEADSLLEPQPEDSAAPPDEAAPEEPAGPSFTSDFDAAFAELQQEIEANPEGEHLDEILLKEGLQSKIARLDFTIPQNESPLTRAVGAYGLSGETPLADPLAESGAEDIALRSDGFAASAPQGGPRERPAAPLASLDGLEERLGAHSLLDPATKERLGQVLDEIISLSVRKAVREEMPRLMEQLAKDHPQA